MNSMNKTGRNPFEYGRELARDELVDREEELAELEAVIRNRGRLFLIGPRRFGKTSLLHACAVEAEREGVTVLRFDVEKYESLPLLAQAILGSVTRTMKGPLERVFNSLSEAALHLRPKVSLDAQGNLSVTIDTSEKEELPILTEALDTVESLAQKMDRPVVLMLDEVQSIVVDHGLPAEKQLRATIQRHRHVSYIFAGSATRLLTAMTTDPGRPFYHLGSRLFLGPVPRDAFTAFLRTAFTESGWDVDQDGITEIMDVAEEVPYNVQRLAAEIWEMLRSGETDELSARVVQSAVAGIVAKEDPAYTQIWTQLTRNQQKALKAVIEHKGEGLLSRKVVGSLGLPVASMQVALQALVAVHLIRSEGDRGHLRYRLIDPFLATWLVQAQVQ